MRSATLLVEHVTKRYGSGATEVSAVRDVSLAVAPGEVVLIMGPSGSGKTTLLLMLGALLKPTEGTIALNDVIVSTLPEKELPDIRLRQFGFVFQDFNLLSALTVLENVAIVAELAGIGRLAARDKALSLLRELGLGERVRFLPEKLSGGEKQRVAIARTLLKNPDILIFDEATSALDSRTEKAIQAQLDAAARGRTTLVIAHRLSTVMNADQILVMDGGRIIERGMHQQLLDSGGVYAQMWALQQQEEATAAFAAS